MTIAIDLRPLLGENVSGVKTYIRNLVPLLLSLSSRKHRFILFVNAFNKKATQRVLRSFHGLSAHTVSTHVPNTILNILLALFRWPKLDRLIGQPIDLFFVPDPRPIALSRGVKRVTTFHDLSFAHLPRMFSLRSRFFHFLSRPRLQAQESDRILAVSAFTKRDLQKTYGIQAGKIVVTHEGVSEMIRRVTQESALQAVRKKYALPEHFFLSLSALEPRKNLQTLFKAFHRFREKTQSDMHLVIAGKKDPRIFQDPHLEKISGVHFAGFIDEEDKASVFSCAQAFITVSYFEGFGLPVVEAMRCGVPVIAANAGALPEICGKAAFLVDPFDVDAIANACAHMSSPIVQQEFQKKALQRAEHFTWKKTAQKTLRAFEQCL